MKALKLTGLAAIGSLFALPHVSSAQTGDFERMSMTHHYVQLASRSPSGSTSSFSGESPQSGTTTINPGSSSSPKGGSSFSSLIAPQIGFMGLLQWSQRKGSFNEEASLADCNPSRTAVTDRRTTTFSAFRAQDSSMGEPSNWTYVTDMTDDGSAVGSYVYGDDSTGEDRLVGAFFRRADGSPPIYLSRLPLNFEPNTPDGLLSEVFALSVSKLQINHPSFGPVWVVAGSGCEGDLDCTPASSRARPLVWFVPSSGASSEIQPVMLPNTLGGIYGEANVVSANGLQVMYAQQRGSIEVYRPARVNSIECNSGGCMGGPAYSWLAALPSSGTVGVPAPNGGNYILQASTSMFPRAVGSNGGILAGIWDLRVNTCPGSTPPCGGARVRLGWHHNSVLDGANLPQFVVSSTAIAAGETNVGQQHFSVFAVNLNGDAIVGEGRARVGSSAPSSICDIPQSSFLDRPELCKYGLQAPYMAYHRQRLVEDHIARRLSSMSSLELGELGDSVSWPGLGNVFYSRSHDIATNVTMVGQSHHGEPIPGSPSPSSRLTASINLAGECRIGGQSKMSIEAYLAHPDRNLTLGDQWQLTDATSISSSARHIGGAAACTEDMGVTWGYTVNISVR